MTVASESHACVKVDWAGLDLYRFFAYVFSPPSRERFSTLAQPALRDALAGLWQQLCCAGDFPDFAWFESYYEYEATYIALFDVGIPEPPVPLFESAHDKTKPAQEIALESTWFYDALGLKWDSRCAVPDYLITQLEFLAAVHYTLENVQDSATRRNLGKLEADFLSRHMLNWIPTAAAKLNSVSPSAFGPFMSLLLAFLQDRHRNYDEHLHARRDVAEARGPQPRRADDVRGRTNE
jgi:DMSO reductase family type II enzyme chaperone